MSTTYTSIITDKSIMTDNPDTTNQVHITINATSDTTIDDATNAVTTNDTTIALLLMLLTLVLML